MGQFFVDDSVHQRAGLILCGVVYCARGINGRVRQALRSVRLVPGVDEFKSGGRMQDNPALARLRTGLLSIVHRHCKVGVIIAPCSDRAQLGAIVLDGLAWMIRENSLVGKPGSIYLDQGMFATSRAAAEVSAQHPELGAHAVFAEQDSRAVMGIQLADVAAHTCATMLLEQLGYISKTVKAGDNSGYDPEWDLKLGFELWAKLRYAFFCRRNPARSAGDPLYDASPGLYVSPSSPPALADAAGDRFGSVYLGCIH